MLLWGWLGQGRWASRAGKVGRAGWVGGPSPPRHSGGGAPPQPQPHAGRGCHPPCPPWHGPLMLLWGQGRVGGRHHDTAAQRRRSTSPASPTCWQGLPPSLPSLAWTIDAAVGLAGAGHCCWWGRQGGQGRVGGQGVACWAVVCLAWSHCTLLLQLVLCIFSLRSFASSAC